MSRRGRHERQRLRGENLRHLSSMGRRICVRSRQLYYRRLRIEPLEDRRLLTTITVNTLVDEADGSIVDGDISLRDAIALATAGDTIDFSVTGTINLTLGQLTIAKDLTINGPGASSLTIDASNNDPTPLVNEGNGSRVMNITDGNGATTKNVTISGLTLTGGDMKGTGGAILNREALTVSNCKITGNATTETTFTQYGYTYTVSSPGGGIRNLGLLTITASEITNNIARGDGGAISNSGVVNLTSTTISGNTATGSGGGITNDTNLTVTASTISGNSASGVGGGVFGPATIISSTISGNNVVGGYGGGIAGIGLVSLLNTTISGNTAHKGGGIFRFGGTLELHHTTVAANASTSLNSGGGIFLVSATPPTIDHSIVADNTAAGVANDITAGIGMSLTANYSLIEAPGGLMVAGAGNVVGMDPWLKTLSDNGGPTKTHGLRSGSPAIDAGNPAAMSGVGGVPMFDQRGDPYSRILHGRIDIGAYETSASSSTLIVDTKDDESDGNFSEGDVALREAIEIANGSTQIDTIEFAAELTAGGPDTILLTLGELLISEDLTIAGPGANLLTIDASGSDPTPNSTLVDLIANDGDGSRVFHVNKPAALIDVEIMGLTLTGGDVAGKGGGIYNAESLTVTGVVITGNIAFGDNGGGICSLGPLVVTGSTIAANSADSGGGIFSSHSGLAVAQSTISGNTAVLGPGGGGITGYYSGMSIQSSTISGNLSVSDGGGILVFVGSTLDVMHSTISSNVADSDDNLVGLGGGIAAFAAFLPPTLDHTIVGNNVAGLVAMAADDIASFGAILADFSLVETPPGAVLVGVGNIVGLDPMLGPLASNGGPTRTHALLSGSPAIDAGDPIAMAGVGGVPLYDQRGAPFGRVFGAVIDIGAYERKPIPPALLGNYNGDGVADAADYVVWRKTLGTMGVPAYSGADGDGDMAIDQDDYGVWRAHFGQTVPPPGSGAGEASSVQIQELRADAPAVSIFAPDYFGQFVVQMSMETVSAPAETNTAAARAANFAALETRSLWHDLSSRSRSRIDRFQVAASGDDDLPLLLANDRVWRSPQQDSFVSDDSGNGEHRADDVDRESEIDESVAAELIVW